MRIQKEILASKISRLKAIVPKQTPMAVLQGVLVSDGWMTATNMELTVKTKLDNGMAVEIVQNFIMCDRRGAILMDASSYIVAIRPADRKIDRTAFG